MTSLGRKKTESTCLANFPRMISQTSSQFPQSQHKRKIRDKNKRYCRQMKWSDVYQEVCFNRETEAGGGGGLMGATRSAPPPPPVMLCLLRAWWVTILRSLKGIYTNRQCWMMLGQHPGSPFNLNEQYYIFFFKREQATTTVTARGLQTSK